MNQAPLINTQSSWTKRAVEVDSPQPLSPSDQLADPHDSTCAQVIHPKAENYCDGWLPIATQKECDGNNFFKSLHFINKGGRGWEGMKINQQEEGKIDVLPPIWRVFTYVPLCPSVPSLPLVSSSEFKSVEQGTITWSGLVTPSLPFCPLPFSTLFWNILFVN